MSHLINTNEYKYVTHIHKLFFYEFHFKWLDEFLNIDLYEVKRTIVNMITYLGDSYIDKRWNIIKDYPTNKLEDYTRLSVASVVYLSF